MSKILLAFLCLFHLTLLAQSNGYDGTYEVRYDMNDGSIIAYKLVLNPDSTFLFHAYEKHTRSLSPEKNNYAKGHWAAKKNLISFDTNPTLDLDDTHRLDFSNSKARIDRKSPRDPSPDVVPDTMRFYSSNIPWVKGMKLRKTE